MGETARMLVMIATLIGALLLAWRAGSAGKVTLPMSYHFDAFLALGVLLALIMAYLRWTRHLSGLSFFMLPMIVVLLVVGGLLQALSVNRGYIFNVWVYIHFAAIVGSAICFSLSCVGAGVYLLAQRQLKSKGTGSGRHWAGLPPLASMEKFNQRLVYLGFPLLTVVMVTGVMILERGGAGGVNLAVLRAKLGFAMAAWIVYGMLLHLPLAPSFRGQRAAWLSILGFCLFIGGYVAGNWVK